MFEQLRLSVGTTWRYARADGTVTVECDLTRYRQYLNTLKSGPANGFDLPWPVYRSTFWQHMFGGPYDSVPTRTFVSALLPARIESRLSIGLPGLVGPPMLEVLWHPFAVTALAHFEVADVEVADNAAAAAHLDGLLAQPFPSADHRVRDGVTFDHVPVRPSRDADGKAAAHVHCGEFHILSALHKEAPDPHGLAATMARLFHATATGGLDLLDEGGAVAVKGSVVALVLPRRAYRAQSNVRCLHHNQALLLAQIENLGALLSGSETLATKSYRRLAGVVLNSLYRRAPLPETNSVYRARLSEAWMADRGLVDKVNAATATLADPPPPLG